MVPGLERYGKIVKGECLPRYLEAKESGTLSEKTAEAESILQECRFCERRCRVNRKRGFAGFCGALEKARVFGAHTHYGEEPELVPSGTLFFSGCTMRCAYCQNAPQSISYSAGEQWSEERIAHWIALSKAQGCKNVNFVGGDPAPFTFNVLKALSLCSAQIAVVWNSNSYYSSETAELLRGIVDVYLADFRYFSNECAEKYSSAPGYAEAAKRNLLAAKEDAELLIRVLVMPSHIECCAKPIIKWIASELGGNTRVNIMDQYYPAHNVFDFPEMSRRLKAEEFHDVVSYAHSVGLKNIV